METKIRIPLIKPDLPPFEEVAGLFQEALESGKVTNFGKHLTAFEQEAGRYLGAQAVAVSSGTLGLVFTLQALGLQPGQKVILPSFSFMATAQAVLYAGGVPVFADVQEDITLSPEDLEFLLKREKQVFAVLPVHLYGLPCKIDPIQQVIDRAAQAAGRPIRLMFDAAHAFGSARDGKRVGASGDAEVFSLSVTKALVCVEGGLVTSRDSALIQRIKKMRNYGIEQSYDAWWPGMNGKMSELHAIVGLKNLQRLESVLETRKKKAEFLAGLIRRGCRSKVLDAPAGVRHTYKDFTVLVPPEMKAKRDVMMKRLDEEGVETRAYFYPPIHEQKFFRRFADRPLPATEDLSRRVITLPFFTSISEQEMGKIAEALVKAEKI